MPVVGYGTDDAGEQFWLLKNSCKNSVCTPLPAFLHIPQFLSSYLCILKVILTGRASHNIGGHASSRQPIMDALCLCQQLNTLRYMLQRRGSHLGRGRVFEAAARDARQRLTGPGGQPRLSRQDLSKPQAWVGGDEHF